MQTELQPPITNRSMRRALQKQRRATLEQVSKYAAKHQSNLIAGQVLLDKCRIPEPGECVPTIIELRSRFERLRNGCGSLDDFDWVAITMNVALVRAEQIDPLLVQTVEAGQDAMARMKERYLRIKKLGFDGPGLAQAAEAVDAFEAILEASTVMQMETAIKEAYRRHSGGKRL